LNTDGTIFAIIQRLSRLPFGLGKQRENVVGMLGGQATKMLTHALQKQAYLRVRIVEVEPPHLSRSAQGAVFLSVWGDPAVLTAQSH